MKILQSLDLDGLDGILSSSGKQRFGSARSKAILALLFFVSAMIILFFLLKHRHFLSPETATQPLAEVADKTAKILPQTAAAQSSDKDEQIAPAATSILSTPTTGASGIVHLEQPQQDSPAQTPMAQAQPDMPVLPTEPTAAGIATADTGSSLFTVYFKFKSSTPIRLSEAETSRLMDVAKGCSKRIRITGHTCHIGNVDDNLRLGQRRANAVKKWLIEGGIAAERIETASEGENMPAAANDTASGQAANRRAVLDCVVSE
ncbi:MAG: OmpA family protein [Methylomonas sp.]